MEKKSARAATATVRSIVCTVRREKSTLGFRQKKGKERAAADMVSTDTATGENAAAAGMDTAEKENMTAGNMAAANMDTAKANHRCIRLTRKI